MSISKSAHISLFFGNLPNEIVDFQSRFLDFSSSHIFSDSFDSFWHKNTVIYNIRDSLQNMNFDIQISWFPGWYFGGDIDTGCTEPSGMHLILGFVINSFFGPEIFLISLCVFFDVKIKNEILHV